MSSPGSGDAKEFSGDELVVLGALADRSPVRWDVLVRTTRLGDDRVSDAVDALVARGTIVFLRGPRPDLVAILLTATGLDQFARTRTKARGRRGRSVA